MPEGSTPNPHPPQSSGSSTTPIQQQIPGSSTGGGNTGAAAAGGPPSATSTSGHTAVNMKSLALDDTDQTPKKKKASAADHRNSSTPKPKDSNATWRFLKSMAFLSLITLVIQNSALVLMTRYSRFSTPPDKLYHTSSLVLNQEILKMLMCLVIFGYERKVRNMSDYFAQLKNVIFQRETWKLIVPAALFTFQNFSLFVALTHLDAMMFQVISQTKLLSAAVFSVMLLDRHLTRVQWFTLVLLTLGILLSQLEGVKTSSTTAPTKAAASQRQQNALIGMISCVASGLSSSFAGVYFEKVVKTTAPSLAVRNIHLSVFGIPFAFLSMLVLDVIPAKGPFRFWRGYDMPLTWMLVCVHALGGLLVAVVVKYADNILKGFATGVAIIVSGVFASFFWGYVPTLNFVAGSVLVVVSSVLYHYAEAPRGMADSRK